MFYLGIDQHARQLTISLRNEEGDVIASLLFRLPQVAHMRSES